MGTEKRPYQTLRLSDVNDQLHQSNQDMLTWQADLRREMFGAISGDDVRQIIAKQVQQAREGSVASAKFIMNSVVGAGVPVKITQTNIIGDVATAARMERDRRVS